MNLLTNAKDSIIMGLEDYSSYRSERIVSCTRNLFAGILLLFKHRLNMLSPPDSNEALIKEKVIPMIGTNGQLKWVGDGKNTVNVRQIRERFDSLGISVNWKRVDRINKFRNNVEHYHTNLSKDAMRDLISNSFLIIRDFVSQHLNLDPKDLLGDYAWNTLISVREVLEKEKEECTQFIESIEWDSESLLSALISFKCTECGSPLIKIRVPKSDIYQNVFYCKSCEAHWDFEDIAEMAIEEYFEFEHYLSFTNGNELPVIQCPGCSLKTYIIEEKWCAVCHASFEHECQRCGNKIPPHEIDGSGFCSFCSHMMAKDD